MIIFVHKTLFIPTMKKIIFTFLVCVLAGIVQAQIAPEALKTWHGNKYSMFIHFGLYSLPGGVWKGQPVTYGYSEQIQAFAKIPKEEYMQLAKDFNPTAFNADSIVALAKRGGMKSVVLTSKHHDGFCMFHTATTTYNSYDATPCKRDFVKELSDACKRAGIRFGLYFSIIDWNFPYASPMSDHNCDFVPEKHQEFSKAQITELLTNYGPISEFWFDMGSNTPAQSKELYELVHKLQPDCMVSGRIGNDQYDFCVMADNAYPEGSLHTPWQTAASMFDETWSYRSWQERGEVKDKVYQKLCQLTNVVSHGGNFLLNIGPKGDGSVVPFEKEVLESIGNWLDKYGYAVYQTEASPFPKSFEWGTVTRKDNKLYLILSGQYPKDGKILLDMPGYKLQKGDGKMAMYLQYGDEISVSIPASAYNDSTIHVLTLELDKPVEVQPALPVKGMTLTACNATPDYSYSCFDYYSNYRSAVAYNWNVEQNMLKQLQFIYTDQEAGRTIDLSVDGKPYTVTLKEGKAESLEPANGTVWGKRYICGPGSSLFDTPSTLKTDLSNPPARKSQWKETDKEQDEFDTDILSTYYVMQNIQSPTDQLILVEVGAGNGIEIYLNGKSILKHLNPYRCTFRTEKVLLPLKKGDNQVVLCAYNRFEDKTGYLLRPAQKPIIYRQDLDVLDTPNQKSHAITVKAHDPASAHADMELSNLRIRLRRIAR